MSEDYGRIAASRPANTSEAELYECTSGEFIGYLTMCNQTGSAVDVSVALTDASGAATTDDWVLYEYSLSANTMYKIPIILDTNHTVRIQIGTADAVSFQLVGLLIT